MMFYIYIPARQANFEFRILHFEFPALLLLELFIVLFEGFFATYCGVLPQFVCDSQQ